MKKIVSPYLLGTLGLALVLCGCLNLKPARQNARYFVLTPAATATPPPNSAPLAVGVGIVKLPDYLYKSNIAIRKGTNEVDYLLMDLWAERLNTGFQRVLAANLSAMVPAEIRLSEWRSDDVAAGVYVAIEQFDVNERGEGVLVAWWRVTSPAGEKVLKSGQFRGKLAGPAPTNDSQGAVVTLSKLAGQLSAEIAKAINETARPK